MTNHCRWARYCAQLTILERRHDNGIITGGEYRERRTLLRYLYRNGLI